MKGKITIAIDGFSSCGKSTLAKALARALNYKYIDSGAMYRAVTLYALNKGIIKDGHFDHDFLVNALPNIIIDFHFNPQNQKSETLLNGVNVEDKIRQGEISSLVSPISAVKEVRTKLVDLQRSYDEHKGLVMDGRDIGTNVFPKAELKIFMTADPEIRAVRRYEELISKGYHTTMVDVRSNLAERDHIDSTRVDNPLTRATDAIILDNTDLSPEEQLDFALDLAKKRIEL
jgi:cytidylate kinase